MKDKNITMFNNPLLFDIGVALNLFSGNFTLYPFEEGCINCKIRWFIIGRISRFWDLDLFFAKIEGNHYNRYFGRLGDKVESSFPFTHLFTGTFRREGQAEFFPTLKNFGCGRYRITTLATVDRGAARPSKKPSKRRVEEAFFGNKIDLLVPDFPNQKSQKKIDPTGVGHDDDHAFIKMAGEGAN